MTPARRARRAAAWSAIDAGGVLLESEDPAGAAGERQGEGAEAGEEVEDHGVLGQPVGDGGLEGLLARPGGLEKGAGGKIDACVAEREGGLPADDERLGVARRADGYARQIVGGGELGEPLAVGEIEALPGDEKEVRALGRGGDEQLAAREAQAGEAGGERLEQRLDGGERDRAAGDGDDVAAAALAVAEAHPAAAALPGEADAAAAGRRRDLDRAHEIGPKAQALERGQGAARLEVAIVGARQMLERAAAALAEMGAGRLPPVRARQALEAGGVDRAGAALAQPHAPALARQAQRQVDRVGAQMADAVARSTQALDREQRLGGRAAAGAHWAGWPWPALGSRPAGRAASGRGGGRLRGRRSRDTPARPGSRGAGRGGRH